MDVKLSRDRRCLFVADYSNHTIRRIDLANFTPNATPTNGAVVSTLMRPDGAVMSVMAPAALCLDAKDCLYVACKEDHTIRKCSPVGTTVGSTPAASSSLVSPAVLAHVR